MGPNQPMVNTKWLFPVICDWHHWKISSLKNKSIYDGEFSDQVSSIMPVPFRKFARVVNSFAERQDKVQKCVVTRRFNKPFYDNDMIMFMTGSIFFFLESQNTELGKRTIVKGIFPYFVARI